MRDKHDEARYSLTINYAKAPPEPLLPEADAAWAAECVLAWERGVTKPAN